MAVMVSNTCTAAAWWPKAQGPIRFLSVDLKRKAEAEAGQQQQDVHCHQILLRSASPGYWRCRILAWLPSTAPAAPDADADPAPPAAKRVKAAETSEAAGSSSRQVAATMSTPVLEEHCTREELPACLAVLQHVYTGQLPDGADVELLCRVSGPRVPARPA